ncbi:Inter-alpha-trypsin inhibitor heavy chain H3 [Apiospora arundinis]|uniref:Inter-alpha-trypsin inhibitor heavy chain H3 n=1 Tax=Apiospora arundinis TaxID=335852 RepID=A0ABR2I8G3_9PEZI
MSSHNTNGDKIFRDVNMSEAPTEKDWVNDNQSGDVDSEASRTPSNIEEPVISMEPLKTEDGLLVRVIPPKEPTQKIGHVPCDIVLVIDVSSSMFNKAPILDKDGVPEMDTGCTLLDIVKHAALTIVHTLDEDDGVGLVTFGAVSKVVHELKSMNMANKKQTEAIIRELKIEWGSEIWQGVETGLGLFSAHSNSGNVPALMLLTDGRPSSEPAGGYARALGEREPLPTAIHTFGFGKHIESDVLSTIANIGGGYYGFIPNSNAVCTVIVNATAHLQSTFATKCQLELKVSNHPENFAMSTDQVLGIRKKPRFGATIWTIPLGNIQYGQSRDIYLRFTGELRKPGLGIHARLTQSNVKGPRSVEEAKVHKASTSTLLDGEIAFHENRSLICRFILMLLPCDRHGTFIELNDRAKRIELFNFLLKRPYSGDHHADGNRLLGEQVESHIRTAVYANNVKWETWGQHYLLSLWFAHAKQLRTSFMDPGVQMYDANSPLFQQCQERLMRAFEAEVKPSTPSRLAEADPVYSSGSQTLNMTSYSGRSMQGSSGGFQSTPGSHQRSCDSWDIV